MDAAMFAQRVLCAAARYRQPYAVFVGRGFEMMPAGGKRFERIERDPVRMAQLVGVFDFEASADDVAAAIEAARGLD